MILSRGSFLSQSLVYLVAICIDTCNGTPVRSGRNSVRLNQEGGSGSSRVLEYGDGTSYIPPVKPDQHPYDELPSIEHFEWKKFRHDRNAAHYDDGMHPLDVAHHEERSARYEKIIEALEEDDPNLTRRIARRFHDYARIYKDHYLPRKQYQAPRTARKANLWLEELERKLLAAGKTNEISDNVHDMLREPLR